MLKHLFTKLRNLFKHKHKWEIIRSIWPYKDGWGTWCVRCHTVVDTGLSKAAAQRAVKDLNENH